MLPTHAGDTSRLRCSSDHPSVHPRSRGEHTSPSAAASASFGSSPLARGTLAFIVIMPFLVRLIPARAGSTFPGSPRTAIVSAHPRSRGEHVAPRPDGYVNPGSSPLARGTHFALSGSFRFLRLIPARAGNTRVHSNHAVLGTAHPRSRGEHVLAETHGEGGYGSSPLARGALFLDHQEPPSCRLIPARAGNM